MRLLVMPEWHDLAEKHFIGEFIAIKTPFLDQERGK